MKAAVLHGARDVRIESRPVPAVAPGLVRLHVRRVGICGSDLHYYAHGACGAFVPDRPFILGHELAAVVAEVGDGVEALRVGDRVTVNPARSCRACARCLEGRPNLCGQVIMLGSASTCPPTDGALAEFVTVRADQCFILPPALGDEVGAALEPLAVGLHAVTRAGAVQGRNVLVMGGGTIGLLTAMAARACGAAPLYLGDPVKERREKALELGVDEVLDPSARDVSSEVRARVGGFDVVFEASGAPVALRQALDFTRPGGTIVQIGTMPQDGVALPVNQLMAREISLLGSMRYTPAVFQQAIQLVVSGRMELQNVVTDTLPFEDANRALERASARHEVLKVQVQL